MTSRMFCRLLATCFCTVIVFFSCAGRVWAEEGASFFDEASKDEIPLTAEDREHWSFRPLTRVALPRVEHGFRIRNPIDCFIEARFKEKGIVPLPLADRLTLIRRLSFDLTGLPPTVAEVDDFLADSSPAALDRLIDRLLSSPAYGERWGQHWLDLARFAETDGFELDDVRGKAWRYRDWVVEAFNSDLPFDKFVHQQLAGDEIKTEDPNLILATGFVVAGPDMRDVNTLGERRHMLLNEITATVGSVFLGLEFACAQCHNHKTDPISQADFYRLRSFFEPLHLFPHPSVEEQEKLLKAERESAERLKILEDELDALETSASLKVTGNATRSTVNAGDAGDVDALSRLQAPERERVRELKKEIFGIKNARQPSIAVASVLGEIGGSVEPSHVMLRGDYRQPGPRVRPAYPRIANLWFSEVRGQAKGSPTSGLRSQLARWLTRRDHPLTTRVIVNRVWQYHFGDGLVQTPSDFGLKGSRPSHPELLDWLASELPEMDWSLKRLHRLILSSAAYLRASRLDLSAWPPEEREPARQTWQRLLDLDPDNRLLARQNRRRLEAEPIRDSLLAVSGQLSRRCGGRGVMPPLPPEIRNSIYEGHWQVSPDLEDHHRRSVYLFVRRNLRYPLLQVFDRPESNVSCGRRNQTTIAPQCLALMNSDVAVQSAGALAELVRSRHPGDEAAQVRLAYRRALGRAPSDEDVQLASKFFASLAVRSPGRRDDGGEVSGDLSALTAFCLALVNLNEFVYVD